MYIAILNKTQEESRHQDILGLYREEENALELICRLANLMQRQSGFRKDPESTENSIYLKNGNLELHYWILEKEVFEDE